MLVKCRKCREEVLVPIFGNPKSLCKKCIIENQECLAQMEQKSPFLKEGTIIDGKKEAKPPFLFDQNSVYATGRLAQYQKAAVPGNQDSVLGKGAYGEVWLVRHKITKDKYAMKVLDKRKLCSRKSSHIKDLEREINIQRRIRHDNIIRLYDAMSDRYHIYILMEYASGGNLFHYIRDRNYLSEKEAFKIFSQVCSAVNFLHKHFLIHRDIKPENVLLDSDRKAKLCDFGCCAPYDESEGR